MERRMTNHEKRGKNPPRGQAGAPGSAASTGPVHSSLIIHQLLLPLLLLLTAAAQTTPIPPKPGIQIITPGGAAVTVGPQGMDPLLNLMLSQPPIDTMGPVVATAEFDPPTVALGSWATYRIIVTALSDTVQLPENIPAPAGLSLQKGGQSQSLQNLGGRIQPRSTFNFRAHPAGIGTILMPAFNLTVAGKVVSVPEARLTIVPAGSPGVPPAPRLVLEVNAAEVFAGQSVIARLVLADPGDGSVLAMSQPQLVGDGFFPDTGFARMQRLFTVRDGRPQPAWISEVLFTPLREGRLTLFGQAHVVLGRLADGRFAQVPGYNPLVDSEPVVLNVKRVPEAGRLAGYSGAIGQFQLEPPQIATNEVKAGEPVALRVTVRGEGNFGRFTAPPAAPTREWQTFPASLEASAGNQLQRQGFATFTWTFIPLSDRIRATPAVPFSYFDPSRATYVDLTIPPVPIKVSGAPVAASAPAPAVEATHPAPGETASGEKPLVFTGLAESPGKTFASLVPWQQRPWFLALNLVPAGVLGGLLFWDRRRRYLAAHPEVILRRRARRAMARQLRAARRAQASRDARGFVFAAVNALRAACAPHEAANPEALVCRDVLAELPRAGANGQDAEVVRRLFAAADAVRFAGPVPDDAVLLALGADFERVAVKLKSRL
jgi:hypothetical protein